MHLQRLRTYWQSGPKARNITLIVSAVLLLILASCLCAFCSSLSKPSQRASVTVEPTAVAVIQSTNVPTTTSTPRLTNTPKPTIPPTATLPPDQALQANIEKALGKSTRNLIRLQDFEIKDSEIYLWWTINDSLTEGLITAGARDDVVKILKAISSSGLDYETISLEGSFSMKDAYGNTKENPVVQLTYSRETIGKINFSGINSDNIYAIADTKVIHPQFLK